MLCRFRTTAGDSEFVVNISEGKPSRIVTHNASRPETSFLDDAGFEPGASFVVVEGIDALTS